MTISTLPATFAGHNLDIVIIGNERWAMGGQLGGCIGYTYQPQRAIQKLYQRNRAEFDISDTMVVELPDRLGRMQLTRLFSHKGATKLAMLAQTPRAAEFRDWAARMLTTPQPQPELLLAPAPALPKGVLTDLRKLFLEKKGARALLRYAKLGLGNAEIAKLLECSPDWVRKRRRMAEALGLAEPPADLARLRATKPFLKLVEARRGE